MAAAPPKAAPSPSAAAAAGRPPLIPLTVVDAPTQRLWAVSSAVLVQAYKLWTLLHPEASTSHALLVDLGLLLALSRLRIPRLDFTDAKWTFIGIIAALSDWLLTGGWCTALNIIGLGAISTWAQATWSNTFSLPLGISEHRVRISDLIRPSTHLLGQHTIHVLPYSTATFSTNSPSCHCIGVGSEQVKIPIFFNNTEPTLLQYSVTSLEDPDVKTLHNVTIPKTSLITLGTGGADSSGHSTGPDGSSSDGNNALTWTDEVEAEVVGAPHQGSTSGAMVKSGGSSRKSHIPPTGKLHSRSNQQRIFHLPIQHVGRIKLERVLDKSRLDARISRSEILVVGCPTTTFVSSADSTAPASVDHRCPGDSGQLSIQVSGLAPLEVSYRRKWSAPSSSRAPSEDQLLTISHISGSRISSSPMLGGNGDGSSAEDALDVLLNRRRPSSSSSKEQSEYPNRDFSWAAPQTEVAPISLDLSKPGSYSYQIEAVKDACGNAVTMETLLRYHQANSKSTAKKLLASSHSATSSAPQALRQIEVHPRAHASIIGCSADRPLQLLKGGPAKQITLKATHLDRSVWTGSMRFEPEDQDGKQVASAPQLRNFTFGPDGLAKVEVSHPGTYVFDSLQGTYCSGEVGSPWSCPVIEVPSPTADISFSSIEDVCAGPVGVKALAVLSGTPPFRLQYEIRRSGQHPIRQERVIERTREEFEFRPSTEGAVQYRFVGLADANYRGLKLDGPVFEQTVHPLAKAQFVQPSTPGHHASGNKMVMRSCEGNQVKADVSLEGTGPFDLTYVVRSGSGKASAQEHTLKGIDGNRHSLDIALPAHIDAHGGSMTVSLVSIKDGKNCERALATSDINIEIRRFRPTAGFITAKANARGETTLLEGREAQLPVRLEGESPWTVEYLREGDSLPVTTTIRQAESALVVDRPGLYTLVSVKDAFCEGSIAKSSNEWEVVMKARPLARFDESAGVQARSNGSLLRPAVCRGTPDSVDLRLTGHFPVEVAYEQRSLAWIGSPGSGSGTVGGMANKGLSGREASGGDLGFIETDGVPSSADARERSMFSAAQEQTVFQLSTEAPGWHVYELLQVGDTSYPLGNIKTTTLQKLEQMVHPLPSAVFAESSSASSGRRGGKQASFCVGDTLSWGRNDAVAAPTVHLSGTAPFSLEFELSSTSSPGSSMRFVRQNIKTHTLKLEVDEKEAEQFKFDKTGEWKFRILSLQDGNGCIASTRASLGEASGGTGSSNAGGAAVIQVADTADIAPVGTRQDFCVGETVEFILSGSSPWTVNYNFNGQTSSASVRQAVFSRIAEKPGVLEIESVAHQQNKCKRTIVPSVEAGMRKTIHGLPTVKVTGGGHYVEDLREGGQAEIVFSLSGIPPFSLTYQRLEAADVYTHPKVLETHTVAGILEDSYKITTNQEGTWRVTWLQDRWCSVSIDGTGRHTSEGRARLALTEK